MTRVDGAWLRQLVDLAKDGRNTHTIVNAILKEAESLAVQGNHTYTWNVPTVIPDKVAKDVIGEIKKRGIVVDSWLDSPGHKAMSFAGSSGLDPELYGFAEYDWNHRYVTLSWFPSPPPGKEARSSYGADKDSTDEQ